MGLIRLLLQNKSLMFLCFSVYLLFWLSIGTFRQSTYEANATKPNRLNVRLNSTVSSIIDSLSSIGVHLLLIDPGVLQDLFVRKSPFDTLDTDLITFGVTKESVRKFSKDFNKQNVSVEYSKDSHNSIDHIFIECKQKIVHLAVLHKYHSYYLIRVNSVPLRKGLQLSYGDKLRAIESEKTLKDENYAFYYPRNVSHYLWLYKTSEFIECNRTLADRMENEFHLYQNASQLSLAVQPMRNIVDGLNLLEKRYWLAGGTLLGWYRHCGLIPFTQDADFGLFAEEYDESIRNHFLGNPITYLWGALGLVNDSLEFRLYTGRYTLDLFWAYREGDHRWCGYQVHRAKFRRILPLIEKVCSCDLFGYRFTIPCSPVDYLDAEYGANKWISPLEKNYTWVNMRYHSMWNDISWMYATRLYTRLGYLRTDRFAIDWISKHFNYSIASIPSFLNIVPNETVTLPPLKTKLVYVSPVKRKKL